MGKKTEHKEAITHTAHKTQQKKAKEKHETRKPGISEKYNT